MNEAQKIRDRKMREIRSNAKKNYADKNDRLKHAKDFIEDLENHGPAGLLHIAVLSNIIGKQIRIWNANGNLMKIFGKTKFDTGNSIDIEYHANTESIGQFLVKEIQTVVDKFIICKILWYILRGGHLYNLFKL